MVLAKNKINFLLSFSHTIKTICCHQGGICTQIDNMLQGQRESSTQQPKIYSFPPPEKLTSPNLHSPKTLLMEEEPHLAAIQLFFSHTRKFLSPNSNFHVTTQLKLYSQLQSLELYRFFNFRLYMYTCHVLIN